MRVTGGALGGRRLASPPRDVRPTADRVREALFARLPDLDGARVLDLYAGTGSLGIEALSRGARRVVFVDRSPASLAVLRRNLRALDLEGVTRIVRGNVRGVLPRLSRDGERFDLVFADPPYAQSDDLEALERLVSGELLDEGATVVVERSRRHPLPRIAGLVSCDARRYGDTVLEWLEPDATPATDPAPHTLERTADEGENDA